MYIDTERNEMRVMRCWPERPSYFAYMKFEGTKDETTPE